MAAMSKFARPEGVPKANRLWLRCRKMVVAVRRLVRRLIAALLKRPHGLATGPEEPQIPYVQSFHQDEMYDLDTKPARIQVKAREEVSQDVCHGLNCQSPCAALAVRSATTVATVGDMRDVAEEAFGWEANGPIRATYTGIFGLDAGQAAPACETQGQCVVMCPSMPIIADPPSIWAGKKYADYVKRTSKVEPIPGYLKIFRSMHGHHASLYDECVRTLVLEDEHGHVTQYSPIAGWHESLWTKQTGWVAGSSFTA